MKLVVVKTGFPSFDTLHAFGLAMVFAESCKKSIQLRDQGTVFELTLSIRSIPRVSYLILESVLKLPDPSELLEPPKDYGTTTHFLNLDGLLATTFNLPGIRVLSITDLLDRPFLNAEEKALWLENAYKKALDAISRLLSGIHRELKTGSDDFLNLLHAEYLSDQLKIPKIEKHRQRYLPVWATFEPRLGFSTRSAVSDCELHSYNLTISQYRFATFLAVVGAARILRAQKTEGRDAVFWLPRIDEFSIVPGFAFRPLRFFRGNTNRAVLFRTMDALVSENGISSRGLHFHILQGTRQPIPIEEAEIDLLKLRQIPHKLVRFWRHIATDKLEFDHPFLSSALFDRNYQSWESFLLSWHDLLIGNKTSYHYSLGEVMEVSRMLDPLSAQPLSAILNEKAGARKFGALLRQLNEINRSEYLEIYDQIRRAQSSQEVLLALSKAMNEILVMKGKRATFRVIPTPNDVKILLEQIESYEVPKIAAILIILASLHVLRKETGSTSKSNSGG